MNKSEEAVKLFKTNCNCAQSVLLCFADDLGFDEDFAKKVSSAFGGGIGRCGMICGAISGALMVLGLKFSSDLDKEKMYEKTREFLSLFKTKFKYLDCKLLTGFDMLIPEQRDEAIKLNISDKLCSQFIENSVQILEKLISETENKISV